MRTLYLHIGQHKTGTTSIQNFCKRNKQLLNKMGFGYTNLPNHHKFSQDVLKENNGAIKNHLNKMQAQKFDKFIVSSEDFCKCSRENIENFAKFLKRRKWNVHIIVYLRRQDKAIESIYTQMLKNDNIKISINDYIKRATFKNLHFDKFLANWSQVFGKKNIKVLLFDKVKNGLLRSFLNSIHIRSSQEQELFTFIKNKKNAKPSIDELRKLIEAHGFETPIYKKENNNKISYSLISSQESTYIFKKFEKGNKLVAEKYFNTDTLF